MMNERNRHMAGTVPVRHIQGGCTLWSRQTLESEIFSKPAIWFKIWFYIVSKANHSDKGQFKRGQCFLKYQWIRESTGASRDQIKHCIEFLKSRQMLATQKATRGMIVTVSNYNVYQDIDNYRGCTKSHRRATQKPQKSHTINNNDNNDKNEVVIPTPPPSYGKAEFEEKATQAFAKAIENCDGLSSEFTAWFKTHVLGRFNKYVVSEADLCDWHKRFWEKYGEEIATESISRYRQDHDEKKWQPAFSNIIKIAIAICKDQQKAKPKSRQLEPVQESGFTTMYEKMTLEEGVDSYDKGTSFVKQLIIQRRPDVAEAISKRNQFGAKKGIG